MLEATCSTVESATTQLTKMVLDKDHEDYLVYRMSKFVVFIVGSGVLAYAYSELLKLKANQYDHQSTAAEGVVVILTCTSLYVGTV